MWRVEAFLRSVHTVVAESHLSDPKSNNSVTSVKVNVGTSLETEIRQRNGDSSERVSS